MADPITENRVRAITKEEISGHEKRIYRLERFSFGNGEVGADEQIRKNKEALNDLIIMARELRPMVLFYKVGIWAAGILGMSILALIWSLITGQVSLVFP